MSLCVNHNINDGTILARFLLSGIVYLQQSRTNHIMLPQTQISCASVARWHHYAAGVIVIGSHYQFPRR